MFVDVVIFLSENLQSVVLVKTSSAFFCNLCSDIVDENAAAFMITGGYIRADLTNALNCFVLDIEVTELLQFCEV